MPDTDTRRLKDLTDKINRGEPLDEYERKQLQRLTKNNTEELDFDIVSVC